MEDTHGTRLEPGRGCADSLSTWNRVARERKWRLVIRRADADVKGANPAGQLLPWQGQVRWSPQGNALAVLYSGKGASELGALDLRRDELTSIASNVMNPPCGESGSALFGRGGQVHRFDLKNTPDHILSPETEVLDVSPRWYCVPWSNSQIQRQTCRVQAFLPRDAGKMVEFDNPTCPTVRWVGEGPQFLVSLVSSPTKGEIWLVNAGNR